MYRRFELHRDVDVSGVSGLGVVADGLWYPGPVHPHGMVMDLLMPDVPERLREGLEPGWCRLVWRTAVTSIGIYRSIEDLMAIHGHGGATRLVWVDDPPVGLLGGC